MKEGKKSFNFIVRRVEGAFYVEFYPGAKSSWLLFDEKRLVNFFLHFLHCVLSALSWTDIYCISDSLSFSGSFSSLCTRLRIILSYSLPVDSSVHNSLQEDGALGSLFWTFGIRTSFWRFHCFGNWTLSGHLLNGSRMS